MYHDADYSDRFIRPMLNTLAAEARLGDPATDAVNAVRFFGRSRQLSERHTRFAVLDARIKGIPWKAIGTALGVSEQAVRQRYGAITAPPTGYAETTIARTYADRAAYYAEHPDLAQAWGHNASESGRGRAPFGADEATLVDRFGEDRHHITFSAPESGLSRYIRCLPGSVGDVTAVRADTTGPGFGRPSTADPAVVVIAESVDFLAALRALKSVHLSASLELVAQVIARERWELKCETDAQADF